MKYAIGSLAIAAFAMFSVSGCGRGSELAEGTVEGRVTQAGEPVPNGQVSFFSPQHSVGALAEINADGTFSLTSKMPTGLYTVSVSGVPLSPDVQVAPPTKIPKKYWNPNTSGLSFPINGGKNNLDIQLSDK